MTGKNPHWDTPADMVLSEEGICEAAKAEAVTCVVAWQLTQEMERQGMTKPTFAFRNETVGEPRQHKGLNNRVENSHQPTRRRERIMKRFKSPGKCNGLFPPMIRSPASSPAAPTKTLSPQFHSARNQAFKTRAEVTVAWPWLREMAVANLVPLDGSTTTA